MVTQAQQSIGDAYRNYYSPEIARRQAVENYGQQVALDPRVSATFGGYLPHSYLPGGELPMTQPSMPDINAQTFPGLNQGDYTEFLRRVAETATAHSQEKKGVDWTLGSANGGVDPLIEPWARYGHQPNSDGELSYDGPDGTPSGDIAGGPIIPGFGPEQGQAGWGMWAANRVNNPTADYWASDYSPTDAMRNDPARYNALLRAMQEYAYQDYYNSAMRNGIPTISEQRY